MKTSIIVLTHNQLTYTKKCIESIRKYTSLDYELIIVDNASQDGTVDYLKKQSDLLVIFNKENVGFAKGNNQAMRIVSGDVVVFLNNDVVVTAGWLEPLINTLFSSKKIAMTGPVTNNDNVNGLQKIQVDYNQDTLEGISEFSKQYCAKHVHMSKRVLRLVGFALACKKEVLNTIGLFDESFGIGNYEDDDLCLRALIKGYELRIVKDSFVHHFGRITFKESKINYSHLMIKNKTKFNKKWGFDVHKYLHPHSNLIAIMPKSISRVLDINCGMGALAIELINQIECKVVGIEKNDQVIRFAQKQLSQVLHHDVETIEISEDTLGKYDCIICNDILQHLKDPWTIVKQLSGLLHKDGYLIILIHNVNHLEVMTELLQGYFSYKNVGPLNKQHLRFFTKTTIPTLFPPEMLIEKIIPIHMHVPDKIMEFVDEIVELGQKYGLKTNDLFDDITTNQFLIKARKIVDI
ncbi:bifunctional glycosyltransferase family 2 protein/class I SAM-dependent methyltransferase [Chengkuizengella marina]|uniref:Glycosyltransferase n=1 Tax=Chengkuizengella marina TaxID=2507566 RepID=A0A6N9PYV8_9BACL|nr:bifunctional glycosyltransferase family 2 protein/class I SAM-dependent methyltransferase [Chengkuizengella marina]NBI28711.1 glycosyltransferase [Chengkuizengella marina]